MPMCNPARTTTRNLALLCLLGLPGICVANAQEAPCLRRSVIASVLTKDGNLVRGLGAANFRSGFPARILSVVTEERARRVVIVLDASGSMLETQRKWALARAVAFDLASSAPGEIPIALVIFASKVEVEVHFSEGREAVLEKIRRFEQVPLGKGHGRLTALWDTILEALKLLGQSSSGDIIYVITDGGDNQSKSRRRDVEDALRSAGVRLFATLVEASPGVFQPRPTPEEFGGPEDMRDSVVTTAGNLVMILDSNLVGKDPVRLNQEAQDSVMWLYRQMTGIYRLEIGLSEPVYKPRGWKLEIVEGPGIRKKDMMLLYPRKLMPCGPVGVSQ